MRFLITAGPTREPIDPVRYLSNRSSGKMGYGMAAAASEAGHDVILISGPVDLLPPPKTMLVRVTTGNEMFEAVEARVSECDVVVMCAAVTDYKPTAVAPEKIKKSKAGLTLKLGPTRDILAALGQADRSFLLVGFAAETNDLEKNAREKLRAKNCDVIVANDVSRAGVGMEADENEVTVFFDHGGCQRISRAPKEIVARELIKIFAKTREKSLTKKT